MTMMRTAWILTAIIAGITSSTFALPDLATAQSPPEDTRPIVVTGPAPVAAGSDIVIEALDPVTIRQVECARVKTSAVAGDTANSRFSLTLDPQCMKSNSGNLRVCWGPGLCQGVEVKPGETVDLGTLKFRASVAFPPDAGGGIEGAHASSDRFGRDFAGIGLGIAALAASGAGLVLVAFARRRTSG
jgi:hypothetical protein